MFREGFKASYKLVLDLFAQMVVPVIKKMVSAIWIDAFFFTVGEHVPEILLQIEVPVPCPEKDENRDAQNRKIQDDEPFHDCNCSFFCCVSVGCVVSGLVGWGW